MTALTDHLLSDGVKKFSDAFDKLLHAVEKKRQGLLGNELAKQTYALSDSENAVKTILDDWRVNGKVRRLWAADKTLWSGTDEDQWLGWLHVVDGQRDHSEHLQHIIEDVRAGGFKHALLLGMGGSSLCPEVMKRTFGVVDGFPELFVLDSTVPAQIKAFENKVDLGKTLFIVSSKSGGTIEPLVFKQYFFDRMQQTVGADKAGAQFIAITDPGTKLHKLAKADRFRHIAHGVPSIGGRYSAMSNFGMVPSAIMGVVKAQDDAVDALEKAGQPVVRITLEDRMDLGQEFFRWQIATAVAGSVLGINAFNQPDVEASKIATRNLTFAYEQTGRLRSESPLLGDGGISLFTDGVNAEAISTAASTRSLQGYISAHLARLEPGDYFAINAYVEMNDQNQQALQAIRHSVRDAKRVATTLGFGPRFLHSTGQLHKGGANGGVFLQITSEDVDDLPIPDQKYTFGTLKRFQAQGDFEVLAKRKRRTLRVHLGAEATADLARLREIIEHALG